MRFFGLLSACLFVLASAEPLKESHGGIEKRYGAAGGGAAAAGPQAPGSSTKTVTTTSTYTVISTVYRPTYVLSTKTITYTQSASTRMVTTTQTQPGSVITSTITRTQPGSVTTSTITQTQPGSVVTSTITQTQPGSLITSTITQTQSASTTTVTVSSSFEKDYTTTVQQPGSQTTVTVTQQGSQQTTTLPASTVYVAQSPSTIYSTIYSTYTTEQDSTVYRTSIQTVEKDFTTTQLIESDKIVTQYQTDTVTSVLTSESDKTITQLQTDTVTSFITSESDKTITQYQTDTVTSFITSESDKTITQYQTDTITSVVISESDKTLTQYQTDTVTSFVTSESDRTLTQYQTDTVTSFIVSESDKTITQYQTTEVDVTYTSLITTEIDKTFLQTATTTQLATQTLTSVYTTVSTYTSVVTSGQTVYQVSTLTQTTTITTTATPSPISLTSSSSSSSSGLASSSGSSSSSGTPSTSGASSSPTASSTSSATTSTSSPSVSSSLPLTTSSTGVSSSSKSSYSSTTSNSTTTSSSSVTSATSTSAYVNQTSCNGQQYTYNQLAGYGFNPSNATDSFGDTIGGVGSAIALDRSAWTKLANGSYTGIIYLLPDRGWNTQGTYNYQARVHKFSILFTPQPNATVASPSGPNLFFSYMNTIKFFGPDGNVPTTGLDADGSGNYSYPGFPDLPIATFTGDGFGGGSGTNIAIPVDAEGLILNSDGSFWVSDEYGPYIYHFDTNGKMLTAIRPPDAIIPMRNGSESFSADSQYGYINGGVGDDVSPADGPTGRNNNHGFEGMTISGDGKTLYVLLQASTNQEGGTSKQTYRYTRFLSYDISTPTAPIYLNEWIVPLPLYNDPTSSAKKNPKAAGQSEIFHITQNQFFVLARDSGFGHGQANSQSVYRHIDIFDISSATSIKGSTYDVFNGSAAPNGTLKTGITPATYCSFLDFNVNSQLNRFGVYNGGAQSQNLLNEKWESIGLVPINDGSDGQYFMFSVSDNDFITQAGNLEGGQFHYSDVSGFNLDVQALVFNVTLPAGVNPFSGA